MANKEKECYENGFHAWNVDYYDDYLMVAFMAVCTNCGASVDTGEYSVEVDVQDYDDEDEDYD